MVIGSGGREHALAWRLAQDDSTTEILIAPGNGGSEYGKVVNVNVQNQKEWLQVAKERQVDLTIVGPEEPLVMGIADKFKREGLQILGPIAAVARLEGSKLFGKKIMQRYKIPTPEYRVVYDLNQCKEHLKEWEPPYVIKVDGLAGGKGVVVTDDYDFAVDSAQHFLEGLYSAASARLLLEQHVEGREISLNVLCDGTNAVCLGTAQDYKRLRNYESGPNTGGMGAYAPSQLELDGNVDVDTLLATFVMPVLQAMKDRGQEYRGFLYPGLVVTPSGETYCLEYNCRLGDPEAQVQSVRWQGDFARACMDAASGELKPDAIKLSSDCSVGIVLASQGYPFLLRTDQMVYLPYSIPNDYFFHGGTRKDEAGAIITSAGRVATCVSVRKTVAEARESAYRNLSMAVLEDSHYRTDIAVVENAAA